jgi:hypothetical protein
VPEIEVDAMQNITGIVTISLYEIELVIFDWR